MNNQDAPAPQPTRNLPVTESESKMLELLRTNPLLAIEEVRHLGKTIIEQWAENTHQEEISRVKQDTPSLTNNGKRNSAGTPPSDRSR
ncbi:MAG: hypothetical protein ACI9R3_002980 [Verrucomicrobiales bacterium]|jgi:hypothetical protein